jgi:hypothetical protein
VKSFPGWAPRSLPGVGLRWGAVQGGLSEEGLPGLHPVGVTLTAPSEEREAGETPGEGLRRCILRGGCGGAAPSEEGAAVKPLGEGPGAASSEEEATRWASRWGARGGKGPEGSLPGWRPGDSACEPARGWSPDEAPKSQAVEGLPMASAVGAPPRRGYGGGRRWASHMFLRGGASGMTR